MELQVVALIFLIGAIVLGFIRKINVGLVSLGLAFILGLIGNVDASVILGGFPSKLFITLLGTMFFFCLLQENNTLELLSKKIVALVGKRTFLIPIIIYLVSYGLSAAGPGAISVQAVMIVFSVSLAVQMKCSPILLGAMAILGAVGGSTSPIALTGIIVKDLTAEFGISDISTPVFIGVSLANFIAAIVLYIISKGYKLKAAEVFSASDLPKFDSKQKLGIVAILVLAIAVVGFRYDVGLVSFALSLILILVGIGNEKAALKLIPWSVLILICGVGVLMSVTMEMGGIQLLSDILASMMNEFTAAPLICLTSGIMSWFSSANGVVMPTLIPTVPDIVNSVGGSASVIQLVMAVVAGSTVAGISPLSTGGSLILATYSQETKTSEKEQQAIFGKLFALSFGAVVIAVIALVGVFKLFG